MANRSEMGGEPLEGLRGRDMAGTGKLRRVKGQKILKTAPFCQKCVAKIKCFVSLLTNRKA